LIRTLLAALLAIAFAGAAFAQDPAPGTIPAKGVINLDVTEATLEKTVCKPGWTKEVRPPTSYTNALKRKMLAAHPELEDRDPTHYELDHKLSEEDGGDPRHPDNLRLQPWATAFGAEGHACDPKQYGYTAECKDIVETVLHRDLCAKPQRVTLEEVRDILLDDDSRWIDELVRRYPKYALTD